MSWMRIRLELARHPQFPEGSSRHGFELALPLDGDGYIDQHAYQAQPELRRVRRFWDGEEDAVGTIRHMRNGRWLFSFYPDDRVNEPIPHLAGHRFREGEYISVCDADGKVFTYRVTELRAIIEPATVSGS